MIEPAIKDFLDAVQDTNGENLLIHGKDAEFMFDWIQAAILSLEDAIEYWRHFEKTKDFEQFMADFDLFMQGVKEVL